MSAESISVLLVDDGVYAHVLRAALPKSTPKVDVERRRTLADATTLLQAARFDAVLLDLNLPDSAGRDTIGRMLAAAPGIPIVVLTATVESDLAVAAVQHGAQDHLVKSETSGRGIFVESEENKGTTFTIFLPRIAPDLAAPSP